MEATKFIIVDGEIRMGTVEFHKELLPKEYTKVSGGGRFFIDRENKRVLLFGSSHDYKAAKKEDILAALPESLISPSLDGYKFFISSCEWTSDAIKECNEREKEDWFYEW